MTIWDEEDRDEEGNKRNGGKGVLTQSGKWRVLFGENPFHLFQLTALSAWTAGKSWPFLLKDFSFPFFPFE